VRRRQTTHPATHHGHLHSASARLALSLCSCPDPYYLSWSGVDDRLV
jgi:hypothetical protein